MRFKASYMETQLNGCCDLLVEVAGWMDGYSLRNFGKEIIITRVSDSFAGESGVHPQKRAFDIRDEFFDGKKTVFYFKESEATELVEAVNKAYPRNDGYDTALIHSFNRGPLHIHVQVPCGGARTTGGTSMDGGSIGQ